MCKKSKQSDVFLFKITMNCDKVKGCSIKKLCSRQCRSKHYQSLSLSLSHTHTYSSLGSSKTCETRREEYSKSTELFREYYVVEGFVSHVYSSSHADDLIYSTQ